MALQIGDKAPVFKLYSSEKEEIALNDYLGKKVLLLFFPQAFTGVCTKELCGIRDNIGMYQNVDAQVLAVSVDSIFTLDKFKSDQSYNFPLLSDFNKEVSNQYDVLHEEFAFGMKGVSKRSAFVIDKEGVIQYEEVLDNPGEMPDFSAINAAIEKIG